jgi:hypothetical protein
MSEPLSAALEGPWVEVTGSPHLSDWLAHQNVSLLHYLPDGKTLLSAAPR